MNQPMMLEILALEFRGQSQEALDAPIDDSDDMIELLAIIIYKLAELAEAMAEDLKSLKD